MARRGDWARLTGHVPIPTGDGVPLTPMRFMSYNKNLRLIKDTPRQIIYPTGLAETIPGSWIQFQGGMFETEDETEIAWLKKHRLFGKEVGLPGAFWVYVPPRDLEAELAAKDVAMAELQKRFEELENSNKKPVAPPSKPAAAPQAVPTLDQLETK